MGERKVLSKYLPPDFDPSLVPKGKKPKDGLVSVRMMLPFSVQCSTCNTFLYRGRKFNSKKERVEGPNGKYLGIQRYRFYIKCTACSRPITFLTDPENADYEMESGGTRNYEVHKDKAKTEETTAQEKEEQEKEDKMKALENRVLESQREMLDMDNLAEIQAMNDRHLQLLKSQDSAGFDAEAKAVLMAREGKQDAVGDEKVNEHGLTEDDEALVRSIKFGQQQALSNNSDEICMIRRLDEDDEKRMEEKRQLEAENLMRQQQELESKAKRAAANSMVPLIKAKRKRVAKDDGDSKPTAKAAGADGGLGSLLGGYGSDSDSD
jgi:hypothetical protein